MYHGHRQSRREWRNALIAVAIAFALAFTLLGIAHPAWAHDDGQWIADQKLRNRQGEWCCGAGDCHPVDKANYTESAVGYTLKSTEVIPYPEAQPFSVDGRLWVCRRPDGVRRCVFDRPPGM